MLKPSENLSPPKKEHIIPTGLLSTLARTAWVGVVIDKRFGLVILEGEDHLALTAPDKLDQPLHFRNIALLSKGDQGPITPIVDTEVAEEGISQKLIKLNEFVYLHVTHENEILSDATLYSLIKVLQSPEKCALMWVNVPVFKELSNMSFPSQVELYAFCISLRPPTKICLIPLESLEDIKYSYEDLLGIFDPSLKCAQKRDPDDLETIENSGSASSSSPRTAGVFHDDVLHPPLRKSARQEEKRRAEESLATTKS